MDYLFTQASMSTTLNNCSFAWIVAPLVGIVGFLTCLWLLKLITSEKRKKEKKKKHVASKLPPGPKGLPIIGNLHQLGGPNLHKKLWEMAKKYGPIMYLRLGSFPLVVVSSAEAAHEFLKVQDKVWSSRPPSIATKLISYNYKGIVSTPYGAHWRHMRKICRLELFSIKRIESFRESRAKEFSQMVRSIMADSDQGKVVELDVKLGHLAANLVTHMLLGERFFESEQNVLKFKETIFKVFSLSTMLLGDFFPWLEWVSTVTGYKAHIMKVKAEGETPLQEFLELKKIQLNTHAQLGMNKFENFLDVLMAQNSSEDCNKRLSDESIKAMIRQLLTAGTDTSSITVEWGIAELLRHPSVATKLREELDSVVGKDRVVNETDIINLPYLQAVTKEVFRLHPPTPLLIPHQSIEATVVAPQGFELPKSTRMFVNVYAIQRDPMVWERPLEFDPERFMKNPEIDVRGAHYQLLPFGSGRRQCPAMGVGILFVQMGLARIMHSFDLSLPQAQDPENLDITERFAINIWLATPLHVIAKPRLPKNLY
ncbi:unnamed protein product [Sphagnum balticum]